MVRCIRAGAPHQSRLIIQDWSTPAAGVRAAAGNLVEELAPGAEAQEAEDGKESSGWVARCS